MNQVNNYESIVLYRGPRDGEFLRIDPTIRNLLWHGELYARIPGEKQFRLVHVRSAVMQILAQDNGDLRESFSLFLEWFRQTKNKGDIKKQISNAPISKDLLALYNAIMAMNLGVGCVFPELQT